MTNWLAFSPQIPFPPIPFPSIVLCELPTRARPSFHHSLSLRSFVRSLVRFVPFLPHPMDQQLPRKPSSPQTPFPTRLTCLQAYRPPTRIVCSVLFCSGLV
ncbi:hypothetical protein AA313_de0207317 [Arthrobotrys entomopaga]|nr:hypothetical protein AA313_de0207317 [Arthrobotrys entomopaga]